MYLRILLYGCFDWAYERLLADRNTLDKLPCVEDAGFRAGNRSGCLPGTRTEVLSGLEAWAEGRDNRVYWLNGLAGTGKSTIAQSFAERIWADGRLGASFFCSRDFERRSSIQRIFSTLAFQLAYHDLNFRDHIVKLLSRRPHIGHESLADQVEHLLIKPLKLISLSTVIIIDALDECKDLEPASAILSLLARHIDKVPLVKFFITGRPERRVELGFRLPSLKPHTEVLKLHELQAASVGQDVTIFLREKLSKVFQRSSADVTAQLPSENDLETLSGKCSRLFICAATIVRFVDSQHHDPAERLELLVRMPDKTIYEGQGGIDLLYTSILREGFSDVHGNDSDVFERLRLIMGCIILLFNPFSLSGLATLLDVRSKGISKDLNLLRSVLLVPESSEEPIRIFHKSFPDYLTDARRCSDPRFFVEPGVYHGKMAMRCLELMKKRLKRNICSIDAYAMNKDIPDLASRLKICIDGETNYGCQFWGDHVSLVSAASEDIEKIIGLVQDFFDHRLLWWLEIMSLSGQLRRAVLCLNNVRSWVPKVSGSVCFTCAEL